MPTTSPDSTTEAFARELNALDERVRVLGRCEPFSGWPQARLAEVAAIARVERYARGTQVLAHDPQRREVLVVAAGSVEVCRSTAGGKRYVMMVSGPDVAVGLVRLQQHVPVFYEYFAYADCVLLHLPSDELIRILDAEPILWRDVAQLMFSRQSLSVRLLDELALGTLEQRLAATLVTLAQTHGTAEEGRVELGLRLPQEQLAAMLGVTRQSANKVLRTLEIAGAIGSDYNRITILDLAALRELATRRG